MIGFPNHGPQDNHKRRAAKNLKEWHDLYIESLDI